MPNQELFLELSSARDALKRSITALIEASNRYCMTFPKAVLEGLPSYADAKSNASAAYYMYATALTYILTSAEGTLSSLAPLAQKATEAEDSEIAEACAELISAYEAFSSEALSPYFDESQKLMQCVGETIALSPLYQATQKLVRQSEEFLSRLN